MAEEPIVVTRIRELIKMNDLTQAEFARRIGFDASNLSKTLNGRMAVSEALINRMVVEMNVSKDWLKGLSDNPEPPLPPEIQAATPVYDIDVTAGFTELSRVFANDRMVGYLNLPQVSTECAVVRVSGDSMEPVVGRDSLVAIRRNDTRNNIFWGQIYVVVMDDYRMVKFVRRHQDDDKVILHSQNPNYDDMVVNRADIRAMFLVETVINISRRY
ncbi:MAG: LexA family transcriptional regulator [Bacteroides sp.]|nr:LexA family transcriptional regulator [Bacteroidales bacterium]MBD5317372.1 LexA family transcriptional regulator [Bacteroides sp.]MBD5377344.1 LexA family transcriptional regulator [Bacteroides sp.]